MEFGEQVYRRAGNSMHNRNRIVDVRRQKELFVEQVKTWRQICEDANQRAEKISIDSRQESKHDKQRIHLLERELHRKEKALAETAALLILRKKLNAFYSEAEDR